MNLQIISPNQELFKGEIYLVQVPGTKGCFEVLKNHAPIVSSLDKGRIKVITSDGQLLYFEIKSGFIEVNNNVTTILVYQ